MRDYFTNVNLLGNIIDANYVNLPLNLFCADTEINKVTFKDKTEIIAYKCFSRIFHFWAN